MISTRRAEGFSPELRASLFHFTVFGTTGVGSAYFSIWLNGKGISSEQIGIMNALPVLLTLLTGLLIGRLADKASDWRVAVIWLAAISGIAALGLLVADGFWGLLLVITLTIYPATALVPVIDAATLRMAERRGSDFGFIRAWGTVGYTIATAMTGIAVGVFSPQLFVPIFIGWGLLRIVLSLPLPRFRAPEHVDAPVRTTGSVKLRELMKPWFLLPCFAYALIQSTHFFLGAMGALVWKIDGIGEGWIGPLIAISAVAEAITMFAWRRVGGTMSARTMLIISCLVATVRWAAMAFNPSLPLLFALQLLHGITLPFSYFGIMHFIANWAPEEIAAEAQGFSTTLTMSALVVTLLVFGWLVGFLGGATYLVAAGMTLVAAGAVYLSLMLRPAHQRAGIA